MLYFFRREAKFSETKTIRKQLLATENIFFSMVYAMVCNDVHIL